MLIKERQTANQKQRQADAAQPLTGCGLGQPLLCPGLSILIFTMGMEMVPPSRAVLRMK